MKHKACLFLGCILISLTASLPSRADVELNGYTFSDDSTELWGNPYYSSYSQKVDLNMSLHGYGDFRDTTLTQAYQYIMDVDGIECDVILEQAYYPTWSEEDDEFQMDYYNGYVYYAKDTEDNIHILSMVYYMPDDSTVSWNYTDLSTVGTTLLYPSSPVAGQEVFAGQVEDTGVQVGDIEHCVTIAFDSLPQFPSRTVTAYLRPGTGVLALSYNWEGRKNGFSTDGVAPEDAEESQSGWEEWKDEHCFISTCSPGEPYLSRGFRAAAQSVGRAWERIRIALTSAVNKY